MESSQNKRIFSQGMRDGIPIGLGYFAVSFSLGIAAKHAGLTPFQGFLASILNNASAGEYAAFTLIASKATYLEIIVITFIANARYLLMSCAYSQKISENTKLWHRFLLGHFVTDEFFGISIARPGYLNPLYTYGAIFVAAPCWAIGTYLGVAAGNLLPANITSALSVSLYGMFLAIIIPPAKKDKAIAVLVPICFIISYIVSKLPLFHNLSDGTLIIIMTLLIASLAAIIKPHVEEGAQNES